MKNTPSEFNLSDHLNIVAKALDVLGIFALGYLVYAFYHDNFLLPDYYSTALVLSSLLILIVFPNFGLYLSWRGKNKFSRTINIFYAWGSALALLLIFGFFNKNLEAFSRVWFFAWSTSSFLYLVIYRTLLDIGLNHLRKKGVNRKKIAIYGAGQVGRDVYKKIKTDYESGFDAVAFIDDNTDIKSTKVEGIEVFAPDQLMSVLDTCHELWIALPLRAEKRVLEILFQTRHLTTVVRYIPDIYNFRLLNHRITEIANIPMIEINGTPLTASGITLKRIEDIFISSLILIAIFPLMLLIALLIKLTSKGPILYKQERHGWNGKTIKVYKFRSMSVVENNSEFVQATKNDSRITPLGRFLRQSSLDELPQFINVLQGRMSVVGPRPHAVSMNHDYKEKVANYMQRHKVKPGITGWAQVNGFRGETDTLDKMEKRVEFDLFYIQNWSLWLDLKIIFLTVLKGFFGKNAY
ncbi:MAG: undecaprenyl-phosphate glucose phosphotransferase [Bdellovibrionales bacterium CG12_big_fil_rev_8_21_14_0_65_38_15]|nr:MAG: undecaprenyl-phosphate glucose phosphotransferase [Bdellovibrionales bacterium CG12_big_fil_rev_8_21_14_0_65_38_15]PIR31283.1 MAG: undecaprenyl-phosphate glucose phosphotransferase [Bdellovibrionales bacterium CG11_big_fil_rev_8_21_14_0_20_38_13]